MTEIPEDWAKRLAPALTEPWWPRLRAFVATEREHHVVHPPEPEVFAALAMTPFDRVRVLILGQDPYPNPGQAHGLAFSVRPGVPTPPSLANLFRERQADLGLPIPPHGYLGAWAERGVLLLNAVLTVREGEPGSHANQGWEKLTDAIIDALDRRPDPVVFVLWGGYARKKAKRVRSPRHRVLEGVHPSPLSANTGFFGSRPFSTVDRLLAEVGQPPVDWSLPDDPGEVSAPERPSDPAVRALAGDPPPSAPLDKVLQLDVWDRLSREDRERVARAVERVLPRAFRYDGLRDHDGRAVAHFRRDGADWVLVPGGRVQLGWSGVKCKLGVPRRRAWAASCPESAEPEAWLAAMGSPPREVALAPFLAAVEAERAAPWLAGLDEDGAVDALQQVRARLAAHGLDLPSNDEAEHLHAGGARTLFPRGAAWPADHEGGAAAVGPFGARQVVDPRHPEATADPDVWRAGGLPASGPLLEAWSAPCVRLDLRLLGASGRWRELLDACRIRPIRRVFPYARRSAP